MGIQKPNIFRLATSELSQDAIIAWLLQWSSPEFKDSNAQLHECGATLLKLLIGSHPGYDKTKISKVEAGRQWENIDIWAEISFDSGDKLLLIIEDKTYSVEHSNQLLRYKDIAQNWCIEHGFTLSCAYIKIGSEPLNVLHAIAEKGFNVFGRKAILDCLNKFIHINDSFITDYISHLQLLEDSHHTFEENPPAEWNGWAWVGLYQYIESQMKINTWHWVNNPSGGFWNLCLNWGYWYNFPVYMQVEQGKLCYKIALGEDETGLDNNEVEISEVQDFVHTQLIEFSKKENFNISRPNPFVHRGNYRTIGVVPQEIWMGSNVSMIDKDKVVLTLKSHLSFYSKFMIHLHLSGFDESTSSITPHMS